jgi:RimJ/RimL family protein N-acetyltransferase
MSARQPKRGYFASGQPFVRTGSGANNLLVIQGLVMVNKPQSGGAGFLYSALNQDYTLWVVGRKPGTLPGCSLGEIANEYAETIQAEFGGPLDVIGISTGGSIAQHFAAGHPRLLRKLVIHSAAHRLNEPARRLQLEIAALAKQGQWTQAYQTTFQSVLPKTGLQAAVGRPLLWLAALLARLADKPGDPSDLAAIIEAEDRHAFLERLGEIKAPTLVIAGENDPFYTPQLFRETAAGIPNARLVLYPQMGHPASGKQFERELRAFLLEEPLADPSAAVYLRPVLPADLPVFFEQQREPEAVWMAAFTSPDPDDRQAFDRRWQRILNDPNIRLRTVLSAEQIAGCLVCYPDQGHLEIGFWLGKAFWGRGITTQALAAFLEVIPERPLYARAAADNQASMRVLEKCGFRRAGLQRGFAAARRAEIDEALYRLDR